LLTSKVYSDWENYTILIKKMKLIRTLKETCWTY